MQNKEKIQLYTLLIQDKKNCETYTYLSHSREELWDFALSDYPHEVNEELCEWYEPLSGFRINGPGGEMTYSIENSIMLDSLNQLLNGEQRD